MVQKGGEVLCHITKTETENKATAKINPVNKINEYDSIKSLTLVKKASVTRKVRFGSNMYRHLKGGKGLSNKQG